MRHVIVYPGESGYWVAECPSLPGCVSQGKTKEDALENEPIPEDRVETHQIAV